MPEKKSFARHIPAIARVLMGLMFLASGLMGLLNLAPKDAEKGMPAAAIAFSHALNDTRYMMQLVSGTQFITGVLLLANRFVLLALALIAPVIVNIFLFHLVLAPAALGMAIIVVLIEIYLAWSYREAFGPMLAAKTEPK